MNRTEASPRKVCRIASVGVAFALIGLTSEASYAQNGDRAEEPSRAASLASQGAGGTESHPAGALREVELEGKVICLPERMHELYQVELPSEHEHVLGFETADGKVFTLLRTRFSEALFADEEVRKRRLLLKGRVFPNTQAFEVTRVRSIRDGTVYDLFYYCTVCSIETVAPGPCACCQGMVELMEKPLPGSVRRNSR